MYTASIDNKTKKVKITKSILKITLKLNNTFVKYLWAKDMFRAFHK